MLIIISLLLLLTKSENNDDYITITGTIYADNWFQLWFNDDFIAEDPVIWTPHQAVSVSFQAPREGQYTFAIYAKDFSDDLTALEYNNNCVGDGGLRAIFDDGTVTNNKWKCKTIYYGPINYPLCFPQPNDDDTRFNPPICKLFDPSLSGLNCRGEYYSFDLNWYLSSYNDNNWDNAIEFSDEEVGWGISPSITSGYINPQNVNWGDSSFIWRNNLQFDNRIICRYTYYHNETKSESESQSQSMD